MQNIIMNVADLDFDGWSAVHTQGETITIGWIYRSLSVNGKPQAGDRMTLVGPGYDDEPFQINENTMRIFRTAERLAKARNVDIVSTVPSKAAGEVWDRAVAEQSN